MMAELDPSKEVPPVTGSSGVGTAALIYDTVTNQLAWLVSFEGLTGPATLAHFHGPANEENNAPPQINLDTDPGVIQSSIGSMMGVFIGVTTLTEEQEGQLLGFRWYVNIHTEANPGGEIRGQIFRAIPIPEPAVLWMLAPATAALIVTARRRGKKR